MIDIPEFRLVPEPASAEARALRHNTWSGHEIGTRHKIGGRPDFIQDDDWPDCPGCRVKMSFYGQLDSIDDRDGRFNIADCGVICVFLCFDCYETISLVRSG